MDIIVAVVTAIVALPLIFIAHKRFGIFENISTRFSAAFLIGFAAFILMTPRIVSWPRKVVLIAVTAILLAATAISLAEQDD